MGGLELRLIQDIRFDFGLGLSKLKETVGPWLRNALYLLYCSRNSARNQITYSAMIHFNSYTCAFPTVACQNVLDAKRPIVWLRPQVFPKSVAD